VKFLNSFQPLGLLILRAALGVLFLSHGYPELTRPGMQSTFVQHGLPAQLAYVAGVLESFGGLLLILGLFVRGAGLLLTIEMGFAIWMEHDRHSIMAYHEYAFPLIIAASSFALATVGAGAASIDHFLFGEGASNRSRAAKPAKK